MNTKAIKYNLNKLYDIYYNFFISYNQAQFLWTWLSMIKLTGKGQAKITGWLCLNCRWWRLLTSLEKLKIDYISIITKTI